jgi:hypothetical protein
MIFLSFERVLEAPIQRARGQELSVVLRREAWPLQEKRTQESPRNRQPRTRREPRVPEAAEIARAETAEDP